MTSLLIKDLSLTQRLDRDDACAVHGGIAYMEIEPAGPGIAPGGCMPWPIPGMPAWPAMAMAPFFPPCGYNPEVSTPRDRVNAPTEPSVLQ